MDIARVEMTDSQQSCWQSILRIAMHTKNAVRPSDARNSGPLFIASEALKPRHRRLWELQLGEVSHLTDDGVLTIFVWMDAKRVRLVPFDVYVISDGFPTGRPYHEN